MNVQHSSRTDRWFTPVDILGRVRTVLGGSIDLDPASEPAANERVRAKRFLTEKDDGLYADWVTSMAPVSVFCNPPGGKVGRVSKTALFWQRLMTETACGRVSHAVFMCFSAEALQTTQNKDCPPVGEFAVCIPSRRISFDFPTGAQSSSPSHSNAIVYVPGTVNKAADFYKEFSNVGTVMFGWRMLTYNR